MNLQQIQVIAEEIGCPDCNSKNVKVLFVPNPGDECVFNTRCLDCGFEFEINPK